MATKQQILVVAGKEVGITEYPPESNIVKYNDWYYGRRVQGTSYPWCAAFVSWVFEQVDRKLVKRTASCAEMCDWFKAQGRFDKSPKVGDVVFFKFGSAGRYTNHCGIVIDVKGDTIKTIEGNTGSGNDANGGAVMIRTRRTNIVGYGHPAYSDSDEYFPKCTINTSSIVDGLKSIGVDASADYRRKIAAANGIDFGSVLGNMRMLELLKQGKLIKP